jgi:LPS sulfotransferase NodH
MSVEFASGGFGPVDKQTLGGCVVFKIIAVVGAARSGTTVLRQTIGSARSSFDLGEVFHGETDRLVSFFGYIHALASAESRYKHPLFWPHAWKRFCSEQCARTGANVLCVDAKIEYFSFIAPTGIPFFIDEQTVFLGIERDNIVAQTLSFISALESNVWSRIKEGSDQDLVKRFRSIVGKSVASGSIGPVRVDPTQFRSALSRFLDLNDQMKRFFERISCATIKYESMFNADGLVSEATLNLISTITSLPISEFRPNPILEKQGYKGFLDRVSNLEELRDVAIDLKCLNAFEEAVA